MQSIQDSENPKVVFKPFLLLGLLANYNKFEFRNPYRLRLEDFVNENAIQKIAQGIGSACSQLRDSYVAIQEDVAEGWTVGNTLAYIGLGAIAPSKACPIEFLVLNREICLASIRPAATLKPVLNPGQFAFKKPC